MPTCFMKEFHAIGYNGRRYVIRPVANAGMRLVVRARTYSWQVFDLYEGFILFGGRRYVSGIAVKVR